MPKKPIPSLILDKNENAVSIMSRILKQASIESEINRIPVITICGSYKFEEVMKDVARNFMEDGCIVFLPMRLEYSDTSKYAATVSADEIHNRHNQKMLMSDFIYVVNPEGYVGKHTLREIMFAKDHNIPIKYLVDPNDPD